jgi:hypothetical protein
MAYKPGNLNSFLFKYTDQKTFQKLKCKINTYEVYQRPEYMSTFGGGHDLCIDIDCAGNTNGCYSKLGHSYEVPNGNDAHTYLAGSYNFTLQEIEVFKII